ncbi:hypothetical protein P4561_11930 [Priestia flexa]|uniref:hypothetical protein n=1 Tax=Priestia flexa TaxID=86664 RepID=UPI002E1EFCFD|nr:hypothetical protein [Priestia flexa]
MNRDKFFTMTPEERVKDINALLQKYDLKQIAKMIGIPYSTFTKEMRVGDFFFHQSDKRYYPFIRSEEEVQKRAKSEHENELELEFIRNNLNELKGLLQMYHHNTLLLLDEQIYSKNATFVTKSIKMNLEIYEEFSQFCEEHYRHLKTQDLIAQSLLDFMKKYRRDT